MALPDFWKAALVEMLDDKPSFPAQGVTSERWTSDPNALRPYILALTNPRPRRLQFPVALERFFESRTGRARATRLWGEGVVAIVLLNFCLLLDCAVIRDARWSPVLCKLLLVTPIAILANEIVRRAPPAHIREGVVAIAICLISATTVAFQSTVGGAGATYAQISIVICALFGNVVMRLRFPFATLTTAFLFIEGAVYGLLDTSLRQSERSVALSLSALAMSLTLIAAYSLERNERLTFLLHHSVELTNEHIGAANRELRKIADSDALTDLPNRRFFLSYLQKEWERAETTGSSISLIAIDVDHFKRINDSHGHPYGDQVLRRIGTLLSTCLHSQNDLAARCGGEEFMVILPDTDPAGALIVAERIRALVRATASPPLAQPTTGVGLFTTVSCGVCSHVPNRFTSVEELIVSADAALYQAKEDGRNCVRVRGLPSDTHVARGLEDPLKHSTISAEAILGGTAEADRRSSRCELSQK